jgi:hypothetical protein
MQLLGRYELSPWLVVGAIAVSAGSLAAWYQSRTSSAQVALDSSCTLAIPEISKDDASHLYRAMQRRDLLPDQQEPQCQRENFGLDDPRAFVLSTQTYACDDTGCEAVITPKSDTKILHCSDGLPELFLLNSEFVLAPTWHDQVEGSNQGGAMILEPSTVRRTLGDSLLARRRWRYRVKIVRRHRLEC